MAKEVEIERKFLLKKLPLDIGMYKLVYSKVGYFTDGVRAVLKDDFEKKTGFICLKSTNTGMTRIEFEYVIPYLEAKEILDKLHDGNTVEKVRHKIIYKDNLWEIDVFMGDNNELIVAEIEIPSEDYKFEMLPGIIKEVTDDKRYYNAELAKHPYKDWKDEEAK